MKQRHVMKICSFKDCKLIIPLTKNEYSESYGNMHRDHHRKLIALNNGLIEIDGASYDTSIRFPDIASGNKDVFPDYRYSIEKRFQHK